MRKFTIPAFVLLVAGTFSFTSCGGSDEEKFQALEVTNIDTTFKPQEDFYRYSSGNWIKNNPVPEDQTIWGGFTVLREQTREQVQSIVLDAAKGINKNESPLSEKIGKFYSVGMDTTKIEE